MNTGQMRSSFVDVVCTCTCTGTRHLSFLSACLPLKTIGLSATVTKVSYVRYIRT